MEKQANSMVTDVVMRHASAVKAGQLDQVMQDFTEQSVVMTADHTYHGLAEIRSFYQAAFQQFPPEVLESITVTHYDVYQNSFYMTYKADPVLKTACDTFLVRDDKIILQTIFMVF